MTGVNEATLQELLSGVRSGQVTPDQAVAELRRLPFAEAGDALVDHHRQLRNGMPETVYGPGKTPTQCVEIVGELLAHDDSPVLLTRTDEAQRAACIAAHGPAEEAAAAMLWRAPTPGDRNVLVISAGTADHEAASEAALALRAFRVAPAMIVDVGVAGLHRLLARLDDVFAAEAIIVVAGMEGALPSVIGGLTSCPVVAVPTSVGYGAGLDGVTALLAMHAACASGITVVGIDNGFGAAAALARMLR